jgi:hypothetical protein
MIKTLIIANAFLMVLHGMMSVEYTAAEEKNIEDKKVFIENCGIECGKMKRSGCGNIEKYVRKYVCAVNEINVGNALAADNMNDAAKNLVELCPKTFSKIIF